MEQSIGRNTPRPPHVLRLSESQWLNATLGERLVHVARADVDRRVVEVPRGSNVGPVVTAYLRLAGINRPAPWCAAAVTAWLLAAGADRRKLPAMAASTYWWWKWAKDTGRLGLTPRRGDLFVWNGKGGGHIGVCREGGNLFSTIEGNTDSQGSREGWEVAVDDRTISQLQRFPRHGIIRIDDLLFA